MDQVKSNFFENQILEAMETVATGVVSKLQFDQTILCTITNDNKRKNGEYEVSDGSSTFKAFSSDTNYKKDMAVYVLIPQGDFERQKTIVGKYVDDTASAINYIPASQSIIEVAKMGIPQNEFGLLANGETKLITIIDSDWDNTNIYDCVSLKASFKTDLSKYNMIDGDYGLILTLEGYQVKSETKEDGTLAQTTVKASPKFYKFSCKDMFGDPYNYNTYFDQDIVFNLSENFADIKINHYRLDFYQNGKFKDLNGNDIPYKDNINNINFNNNLFVKDIQMSFGYSTVDIKEEGIQIYTPDNLKYINRLPAKNIVLKWFQKNEVGNNTAYGVIDTLDEAKENNYSVYWYRYRIGASEDELAGAFWELLDAGAYNDNVNYNYQLVKDPDGKYTYKDSKLILANSDTKQEDKYKMKIKVEPGTGRYDDEKSTEDPFNISFAPDKLLNREKIKAILVKYEFEEIQEVDENDSDIVYITFESSPKIYESNEIIFENANPASLSLAAVDLIKNMRLECADDSNGVYKLYNTVDNEIINNENTKEKILEVFFDTYSSRDIPKDDEQCKITWKIPRYNSMINPVNFTVNKNINKILDEGDSSEIPTLGENLENVSWSENGNYHTCSYEWNSNIAGFDSVHEDAMLSMKYSIDKFYSQSYSNNTIICEIEKYGKTYTAEIEFIFGETGTNGTGYTVSLKLEKEYYAGGSAATTTAVPCVTYNGEMVKVIASLFDEHGKDISEGKVFAWDWLNNETGFNRLEGGNNYCYVQHDKSTAVKDCYGILSATVAGTWLDKNVQLTGYLPLGIRSSSSMKTYEGTTKIIYNEQGSKPTYQKEHSLDTATNNWEIQVLNDNTWGNFAPYFKERKVDDVGPWILVARDMYFSDLAKKQIVIHAYSGSNVIYAQSLLYDQNRFGNAMFNNWDGSLVVDNDDNKILAAIVGAGKKDNNNTFTGVVMGETSSNTGLFGYHQGTQTFGFDTSGTAFIGASGKGQILFNGENGIIQSGNYTETKEGIKIDLDDGKFELNPTKILKTNLNGKNETDFINSLQSAYVQINTNTNPYFEIKTISSIKKDKDGNYIYENIGDNNYLTYNYTPLIYIGNNEYYLQSKNFAHPSTIGENEVAGTGVRFDLDAGKLYGYDFKIQAGQKNKELIINSDSESDPLTIGSNFKVNWEGKITATDGDFTGKITANTGAIGGWNINTNVLYTGVSSLSTPWTAGDSKAIIHTGNGISVNGLSFKTKTAWQPGDKGKGEYPTSSAISTLDNIILNIGKNFAVNKEGKLYIQDAQIGGYATETDLTNASSSLKDVITSVDTTLTTNIGKVNLRAQGSITKLGNLNDQAVFLSTAYSNSNPTLIEGYLVDGNFYPKVVKYSNLIGITKDKYYVDLNTDKYYIAGGDAASLQLIELTELPITVKESDINKVYISAENNVYTTKDYQQGASAITPSASAYYFDLKGSGLYKYKTGEGYILTDPDEVMIFTVSTEGLMTASNAVISGTIFAKAGNIGGWDIRRIAVDGTLSGSLNYGNNHSTNNGSLQSTPWIIKDNHANLTPAGLYIKNETLFKSDTDKIVKCILNVGTKFAVDINGKLYSTDGEFSGKIISNSGSIAGWTIDQNGIYKGGTLSANSYTTGQGYAMFSPSGTVALNWTDETGVAKSISNIMFNIGTQFAIDKNGKIYASGGEFSGKVSATEGEIAGWTIGQSLLVSDSNPNFKALYKITKDTYYQYMTGLQSAPDSGTVAFFVKRYTLADTNYANGDTNMFYVKNNGEVFASNLIVQGKLEGKDSSGSIGFRLNSSGDIYSNNAIFNNVPGSDTYDASNQEGKKATNPTIEILNGVINCEGRWTSHGPTHEGVSIAPIKLRGGFGYYPIINCRTARWYMFDRVWESFRYRDKWVPTYDYDDTDETYGQDQYYVNWCLGMDGLSGAINDAGDQNEFNPPQYRMVLTCTGDGSNTSDTSTDMSSFYFSANANYETSFYAVSRRAGGVHTLGDWSKAERYWDNVYTKAIGLYDSNAVTSPWSIKGSTLGIMFDADVLPEDTWSLGSETNQWLSVYSMGTYSLRSTSETYSNVSDARLKDIQQNDILKKSLLVYNNLNPIVYKYKNLKETDNHSRTHIGFLAQEVEQEVQKNGLTSEDFSMVQIQQLKEPIPGCEDGKKYYLNYNELHGLHVLKNQEQDKRILELEQKVQYLENKILELSGKGV